MKKLFIHHPVFRLFSPLFGGSLVYLLILLSNNDVEQINEEFLTQELYFCIGLSYLIQEFSRLTLILFARIIRITSQLLKWVIQVVLTILLTFLIVSSLVHLYYEFMLGYTPNFSELLLFNVIFSVISLMYISMYLSHQFLYQINTSKINIELERKSEIQEDYRQYIRGINPELLFEGLEALIVQMKLAQKDSTSADPDELLDVLSMVYRYLLSNRSKELIRIEEEVDALVNLTGLFDYLRYSKVKLAVKVDPAGKIVPGTLFYLVQELVKVTIHSPLLEQEIELYETDKHLILETLKNDKVNEEFMPDLPEMLNRSYSFYANEKITIKETDTTRSVLIPKITINTD
ncbi:MAG: histidine kinase [Bacteroidota bacterium]